MTLILQTVEYLPNMMYAKDWINLLAIVAGPILAVQVQKYIEHKNANKHRKIEIFKTLMATRGTVLSTLHVEALNRIDLEFSDGDKYKNVIDAWKEYFDNLSIKAESPEALVVWGARNNELLANMLYEMGKALGYNFNKSLINRNWYSPVAHGTIERENDLIRKGFIDVLEGNRPIPMEVQSISQSDEEIEEQKQLRKLMIDYYTPKTVD